MRRGIFGGLGLVIIAVIAFAAYFSLFTVDPTQQVLVLRFGEVVRSITTPGLYVKVPLIDNAVYTEKRILDLDTPELEVIASDQKRLVVDAFGRYRIVNQLLFYQTVGSETVADARLSVVMNSAVRRVLGEATFIDLVRNRREELMARITEQVNREAQRLGIEMVDVKIRRADLPEANSQAIYTRMQTERQREAAEIRAEGAEAAQRIRARADRDVVVVLAEANREAERVRGEGDGQRNNIFAQAYGQDQDFFSFYRSMQAYEQGLKSSDTRLLLSPDSEFFRFFRVPTGAPPAAPRPAQ